MTIAIWSNSFPIFTTATVPAGGAEWNTSVLGQTSAPIVIDAETATAGYVAGGLKDYTIDLTAQDWLGDQQAYTLALATTGEISLSFPLVRNAVFSSSGASVNDAALWWSASATAGTYDLNFETYIDYPDLVATITPALEPSGNVVTLDAAVADPVGWSFANDASDLVLLYGTSASATTKNLNIQVFSSTGQALTSSLVAESSIPLSTTDGIYYTSTNGTFNLVQTATVDGTPGMEFTPINISTGALGTPVYQAFPEPANIGSYPITITSYALGALSNGDVLEFIDWQDPTGGVQGISTRLLNSSFTDITASTPSFDAGLISLTAGSDVHWQIADLANGETILVYAQNGIVNMTEFGANGNKIDTYGFFPAMPFGAEAGTPSDFDSVVAMGSRFEVTYKVTIAATGLSYEYGVIYDTATGSASFAINDATDPTGQWVGTPFNDTVTYGAGVNEVNGGGGSDTFVATNFATSQVSVIVNAQGNVVLSDNNGDIDTLERFSTIDLSNSTISIAGEVLTDTFVNGSTSVSHLQFEWRKLFVDNKEV